MDNQFKVHVYDLNGTPHLVATDVISVLRVWESLHVLPQHLVATNERINYMSEFEMGNLPVAFKEQGENVLLTRMTMRDPAGKLTLVFRAGLPEKEANEYDLMDDDQRDTKERYANETMKGIKSVDFRPNGMYIEPLVGKVQEIPYIKGWIPIADNSDSSNPKRFYYSDVEILIDTQQA